LVAVGATSIEVAAIFLNHSAYTISFIMNIFELSGGPFEHAFDSRIRSPDCCDHAAFWDVFATFADKDDRFFYAEIGAVVAHYSDANSDRRPGRPDLMASTFGFFLTIFGEGHGCPSQLNCSLDLSAIGNLWIHGRYPSNWQLRTWTAEDADDQIKSICDSAPLLEDGSSIACVGVF
jgi:hypothetical protein